MTFFKNFLFKATRPFKKEAPNAKRKTLLELFKTDLSKVPDSTYEESTVYLPEIKANMPVFFKKLDFKECGLFNHIEVIRFSEDNFNVSFTTYETADINPIKLIKLVDRLHGIFGPDKDGQGPFTVQDFAQLQAGFWMGRCWPAEALSGKSAALINFSEARLQLSLVLSRVKLIASSDNPERLMSFL